MGDLDYKHCWEKLRGEFSYLTAKEVGNVSPYVVLGYMDYIEQLQALKQRDEVRVSTP